MTESNCSSMWSDLLLRAVVNEARQSEPPNPDRLLLQEPIPGRNEVVRVFRWLYHDHWRRFGAFIALERHHIIPDDRGVNDPLWQEARSWANELPSGGVAAGWRVVTVRKRIPSRNGD